MWLVVNLDFLLPIPVGPQVVLEGEGFVLCSYGQCFGQQLQFKKEIFFSAVMGLQLEESGWTMSGVLVLNQG